MHGTCVRQFDQIIGRQAQSERGLEPPTSLELGHSLAAGDIDSTEDFLDPLADTPPVNGPTETPMLAVTDLTEDVARVSAELTAVVELELEVAVKVVL